MNEIRLKGTLKFAPRTNGANVFAVVTPIGEQGGVDVACWASDAPEAAATLGGLREGSAVTILGKLVRKKDKLLGKVKDGALQAGDVWVLGVTVVKLRVDVEVEVPF